MFNRILKLIFVLASVAWIGGSLGCQTSTEPIASTLSGSVVYRERIMLPPTATIKVMLEDVSRMDVAATILAEQTLTASTSPPYDFTLRYDPATIDPRGQYALRARIENEGQLLFINTSRIPAFGPDPAAPVEVLVTSVSHRTTRTPESMPDASLTNTYWKAVRLGDQPVVTPTGQREIHFVLQGDGHARGHSGCNSFRGSFTQSAPQLSFGPLASTRMACPEGMEQEQRLLAALGATDRFKIKGDTLSLTNAQGDLLLYCEAVYLR